MFVSKKKLEELEAENEALRQENEQLMADNKRLSDCNLDLWYDNLLLKVKLQRKKQERFGEYFYDAAEVVR